MKDPGLVENRVDFGDKGKSSKANGHLLVEGATEADNDKGVVDEEHAELGLCQHVARLSKMDPNREGHQAGGGRGWGEHQVVPHVRAAAEGEEGWDTGESCGDLGHVGGAPLPEAVGGGKDGGRRSREKEPASQGVEKEAKEDPGKGRGAAGVKQGGEE